jgi:2-haloalkanoic acid dehalogenase type II
MTVAVRLDSVLPYLDHQLIRGSRSVDIASSHRGITEADVDELRTRMLTMQAHDDVPSGLKQLKEAGFRLVTCTNSPPDPETNPLKHAGIDSWFERPFSIDRVRRFKPAPQVYHTVSEELNSISLEYKSY